MRDQPSAGASGPPAYGGRGVGEGLGELQGVADAAEGDGWVTAVIWRAGENRSDLAIFEAQDIAKGPIAITEMPRRVPFGFHGNWAALD